MPSSIPAAPESASLRLAIEGEMTIYRAAALTQQLLDAITPHARLELDLSKVSEFDSAGLQVLFVSQRSARAIGGEVVIAEPSPAVREVFTLLGLGQLFTDHLAPTRGEP